MSNIIWAIQCIKDIMEYLYLMIWPLHFSDPRVGIFKFFCWYFGPNDDTKRTFWNKLTFSKVVSIICPSGWDLSKSGRAMVSPAPLLAPTALYWGVLSSLIKCQKDNKLFKPRTFTLGTNVLLYDSLPVQIDSDFFLQSQNT